MTFNPKSKKKVILKRRALVLHMNDASEEMLTTLVDEYNVGGLLLVLPSANDLFVSTTRRSPEKGDLPLPRDLYVWDRRRGEGSVLAIQTSPIFFLGSLKETSMRRCILFSDNRLINPN